LSDFYVVVKLIPEAVSIIPSLLEFTNRKRVRLYEKNEYKDTNDEAKYQGQARVPWNKRPR
jgi:hypothetical protein